MSEENTISNIKINGTTYAINDSTKAGLEEVNELIEITTENNASILSANNKLDELLSKVESSGLDTSDATATAIDIVKDKTAYVNGEKITGTLEKEPNVDLSNVTASSGTVLEGYKFVDKNGSLIEGSIVSRSTSTDYPGAVTFSAGYYPESFNAFIVAGNVSAVNVTKADVREGISFIGADGFIDIGTMEASSVDLSSVTAEAQYVLSGQKFVNSSGTLVTGTAGDARANYGRMEVTSIDVNMGEINLKPLATLMPNGTAIITPNTTFFCSVSNILMDGTTITPTKLVQTISSRGKLFSGDITINPIPDEYITTTDANAMASDIAKDKTAYVNGQKITGTMEASSGDSSNGGMEFYECAGVESGGAGEVSTRNGITVHNGISDLSYTLEYNAEDGSYIYERASNHRYVIKYMTSTDFSTNTPGWIYWEEFDGSTYAVCGNKTAGADADTAEIVAGPWVNDVQGFASDYTFSVAEQATTVSESGSTVTTWSGYKMEWREGSSSPAVSAIRISGTTNGVADGDYVSDTALSGSDRKFINTKNSNAYIEYTGDGWGLNFNGTARVIAADTNEFAEGSVEDICNLTWHVKLYGNGTVGSTGDEMSVEAITIEGSSSPSGWYKTDTLSEGLEVKGYYPVVGRIYNADTTVWARDLFVQQEGKMVLLVGFEENQNAFMDSTDTCFCQVTAGAITEGSTERRPKFGDYMAGLLNNYYLTTDDLPEMDEFTLEFFFIRSSSSSSVGYDVITMPDFNGKVQKKFTSPTIEGEPVLSQNIWNHYACVRRKGTGIVEEYLNGIKRSETSFDAMVGGRPVWIKGPVSYNYLDQVTIFDYAKYTSDFTPPTTEYLPISSGLNQTDYPTREVGVSGCACRFVNNKSYALRDSSKTGNDRIWSSSDDKYHIRYDYDWVLTDSLDGSGDSKIYARCTCPMDEETLTPLDIDPIGYPDWKDNFTQQPISVTYTGESSNTSVIE